MSSSISSATPHLQRRAALPLWAALGAAFGLVSAAAIALFAPIGVSGTYSRVVHGLLRALAPGYAATNRYVAAMGALLVPETMLVVGLAIGGALAARRGRAPAPAFERIHARETTPRRRYVDAFAGGFLLLFGARLAGGCTSGHIISGVTQLAVSGLLFGAAVFASGIAVARGMKGAP